MTRPKQAPARSINLLATRTDSGTFVKYNETKGRRDRESHGGVVPEPALIRIQMPGRILHRDLVLRSVAAACKLVKGGAEQPALQEFSLHVVTAVGEAFNNIVLHSYADRDDGIVEIDIQTGPDRISIEFRDWGESFDPNAVPLPDLDTLPESGLGIFIIKTLMQISYEAGKPNVFRLSKQVGSKANRPTAAGIDPIGGEE
jgi:serine/threonine-protein kinase RsbW